MINSNYYLKMMSRKNLLHLWCKRTLIHFLQRTSNLCPEKIKFPHAFLLKTLKKYFVFRAMFSASYLGDFISRDKLNSKTFARLYYWYWYFQSRRLILTSLDKGFYSSDMTVISQNYHMKIVHAQYIIVLFAENIFGNRISSLSKIPTWVSARFRKRRDSFAENSVMFRSLTVN